MAFLSLKGIGKIYVSEGNVAVGIRGVNLDFEKGEFVAVTGKSGSGKSTLLNVISGMDTYEEGELYIEGNTTSHYLQPEWEEYRSEYISFIFQDYNIIESFTVLQNVELALMHITDKKERRKRALELIDRVGMTSHIKHKGSRLSGGQKQRTVIARALAKDSPIILADEPTGNLDSATSVEIIELLREVSKDKLLIVVTHNYEEVERYATRHVRFFDGAVESNTVISAPAVIKEEKKEKSEEKPKKSKSSKNIKDGITLGKAIFTSMPKLSIFLCFLMIVGTLGVFLVTSFSGSAADMFRDNYMFRNIEGRLIVTKRNGGVITEEELQKLASENGAKSVLHYDYLLDAGEESYFTYSLPDDDENKVMTLECSFGEDFGDDILGRYPKEINEILLYLPISQSKVFGEESILIDTLIHASMEFKVTGIKYYYDNNIKGRCIFTKEGFEIATAKSGKVSVDVKINIYDENGELITNVFTIENPSLDVEEGKILINCKEYYEMTKDLNHKVSISFTAEYKTYDYFSSVQQKEETISIEILEDDIIKKENATGFDCLAHPKFLYKIYEEVLSKSYRQASLFFEDYEKAYSVSEKLNKEGYLTVPADTTFEPDGVEVILTLISGVITIIFWFLAIVFLAFFVNLCSSRTIGAFKGDMAIMRSMGISVKTIRVGMYVRMFIALIPAFISVIIGAFFVFTSPTLNGFFTYLYADQYFLIAVGMIILTYRVTRKQIKALFGESVKKALKGGEAV